MSIRGYVVCVPAMMLGTCLLAVEPPAGTVKISGQAKIEKRDGKKVVDATFKDTGGKVHHIDLDEKGLSLAGVTHDVPVEIYATLSNRDGKDWLKVFGYVDPKINIGHEYWRRSRCNACVVLPATRNAEAPANLRGAVPVAGRDYFYREKYTAWAKDDKFLWVASDNALTQIDLKQKTIARTFYRKDGLPDRLIYGLASDGKSVWIVHRGGVACLDISSGKITDIQKCVAKFAKVCVVPDGAWIVADTGTFHLKGSADEPVAYPALPTGERIGRAVEKGIWTPHWQRRTAVFMGTPVAIDKKVYVCSWGDIYEFADGKWAKLASGGYEPQVAGGKLWYLTSKGVVEYDPATKATKAYEPPAECSGRFAGLVVRQKDLWVHAEPVSDDVDKVPVGGGMARFDTTSQKWQTWSEINGRKVDQVATVSTAGEKVCAVTMSGKYKAKSAHPGMTSTTQQSFDPEAFAVNFFDDATGKWVSQALPIADLESRMICGQDASTGMDVIIPQFVESISVGSARVFAASRLMPRQYFGGYWPCVEQLASGEIPGGKWDAKFVHHPEELNLHGEQPAVLNISNGELTRIGSDLKSRLWEAMGHDLVLGLFSDGKLDHWAITEGCVGAFDEASGKWRQVLLGQYRWYWRATTALEDGKWLYIGSDRGLVGRLDTETGRFDLQCVLKNRSVSRIVQDKDGRIIVGTKACPLGILPAQLIAKLDQMESEAAIFDGKAWKTAKTDQLVAVPENTGWSFKLFEKKDHMDKSDGNFLMGPGDNDKEIKPRYYVKESYYPQFLCKSTDGKRIWVSTYIGLLRLDLPAK